MIETVLEPQVASFAPGGSIADLQRFVFVVYSLPDDRLYSISDLLANQERFTMRALKGIRKGDAVKLASNLLIALSWSLAVANRLHVDLESVVWKRFPYRCSYCGTTPCTCKATKPTVRANLSRPSASRPGSLAGFQQMFAEIYPPVTRTLPEAGVHLAEEMGEASEAVHNFIGTHGGRQFVAVQVELADYISCVIGVANSASIPLAERFATMYARNCHVCHQLPCRCSYDEVASFTS